MNQLPPVTIKKVTAETEQKPVVKTTKKSPTWRNQDVVRSDQKDSGYRYNDWRNW